MTYLLFESHPDSSALGYVDFRNESCGLYLRCFDGNEC